MTKQYFVVELIGRGPKIFEVATETKQFLELLLHLGGPPNDLGKEKMSKIAEGKLNEVFSPKTGFAVINFVVVHLGTGN